MPACCLGRECKNKSLQLRAGHKCRQCKQVVHSIGCSVMDDAFEAHENLQCLSCAARQEEKHTAGGKNATARATGNPKSRAGKPKDAQPKKKAAPPAGNKKPPPLTDKKKSPKEKGSGKRKVVEAATRVEKIKKTPAQKSFVLEADEGTPDPLMLKTVCFDVHDAKYGTALAKHLYPDDQSKLLPSLKKIGGNFYLFGTVMGVAKKKKKTTTQSYNIQWEDTTL